MTGRSNHSLVLVTRAWLQLEASGHLTSGFGAESCQVSQFGVTLLVDVGTQDILRQEARSFVR